VIESRPTHLLVRPLEHHQTGQIEVMVNGDRATGFFRLPGTRPAGEDARPLATSGGAGANGSNGSSGGAP
jgi:hypothetical protein